MPIVLVCRRKFTYNPLVWKFLVLLIVAKAFKKKKKCQQLTLFSSKHPSFCAHRTCRCNMFTASRQLTADPCDWIVGPGTLESCVLPSRHTFLPHHPLQRLALSSLLDKCLWKMCWLLINARPAHLWSLSSKGNVSLKSLFCLLHLLSPSSSL